MSDDEIRRLAVDVCEGRVFGTWNIPECDARLVGSIFLPVGLGALAEMPAEEIDRFGEIYEYMDKAGERAINGYPMFFSMRLLEKDDATALREEIGRYRAMKAEFVGPAAVAKAAPTAGGRP
jgi:hypothetical protein